MHKRLGKSTDARRQSKALVIWCWDAECSSLGESLAALHSLFRVLHCISEGSLQKQQCPLFLLLTFFFFFFVKVKIFFEFLMVSKKRVFCKSEEVWSDLFSIQGYLEYYLFLGPEFSAKGHHDWMKWEYREGFLELDTELAVSVSASGLNLITVLWHVLELEISFVSYIS